MMGPEDAVDDSVLSVHHGMLEKLFELEKPAITEKMLEFLQKEDVLKLFIGYVTQRTDRDSSVICLERARGEGFRWQRKPDPVDVEGRFTRKEASLEQVKRSYWVMKLICGLKDPGENEEQGFNSKPVEEPSSDCLILLRRRTPQIMAYLFDAFHPSSSASLYHVCKILDIMMRYLANEVTTSFHQNKKAVKASFESMLRYCSYPCVSDTFLTLLCPIARSQQDASYGLYQIQERNRSQYFSTLASMDTLSSIADNIWMLDASDAHKAASADLLQIVIQRFSAILGGELFLKSLVRSSDLLRGLTLVACGEEYRIREQSNLTDEWTMDESVETSKSKKKKKKGKKTKGPKSKGKKKPKVEEEEEEAVADSATPPQPPQADRKHVEHSVQRDSALDALRCIVDLSTKDKVPGVEIKEYKSFAETLDNFVPCQLLKISSRIIDLLDESFESLIHAFGDPESYVSEDIGKNVKHTSYTVDQPFSNYRLELIKIITVGVAHETKLLQKLSNSFWHTLTEWFLKYPHCNLFHVEFFRLFMIVLKVDNSTHASLKYVLEKSGFLENIIHHFSDEETRSRSSACGHILQLTNALRLQADALGPDSWLAAFLKKNKAWDEFSPVLRYETLQMCQQWAPSDPSMFVSGELNAQLAARRAHDQIQKLLGSGQEESPQEDSVIGLGSEYANQLGFEGVSSHSPQGSEN
uniref:Uncharacterized protein n=1 Tax=Mucochytrium quahogii TaxID=96639 RepID=A0A7S2W9J1_9STRA|mmetsp:Transcript_892/g.969  ORF Transcript_892/g.969 Transcript_892/m.969 type:complete len:697 (+) Transcript_892:237-2327(+)|eukprot:CAMPEP_0203744738 /NCGR_PEP_ID=MMETSP0098-20131031/707_1 /ASSEMBLY_ACC=CAM_ASM_000208 /TAXON_ID=96639 /ORGANISM=" , Strain NY0313808BC1" /LENGTH=696 /DNA_ID=CAMNT_0050632333 /DNA_START=237 /DNA_END=2327 /DNA_ORIENTATION=-